jgi:hypothetical protein
MATQRNNRSRNSNRSQQGKGKPNNVFGYYAVKFIADSKAHYKMRNPLSLVSEFLQETTDTSKYDIRMEDDGDDLVVYVEGDIDYLNDVMNKRIVLEELNVDTTEWSQQSISQLCRFTIKTDSSGQLYSSINHQRSMTDIEINITYDDIENNMNLSILAPAWKCTTKTQELVNTVVDVIYDNIMNGSTALHQDIIKCFNDFNARVQEEHPSNNSTRTRSTHSTHSTRSKCRTHQPILKNDNVKDNTSHKDNETENINNRFASLEIVE